MRLWGLNTVTQLDYYKLCQDEIYNGMQVLAWWEDLFIYGIRFTAKCFYYQFGVLPLSP